MNTKNNIIEAAHFEGGTRHLVERSDGRKFEVLKTRKSYGGTQGLYEINPLTPWGEGDTNRGKGFIAEKDIDNAIDSL